MRALFYRLFERGAVFFAAKRDRMMPICLSAMQGLSGRFDPQGPHLMLRATACAENSTNDAANLSCNAHGAPLDVS